MSSDVVLWGRPDKKELILSSKNGDRLSVRSVANTAPLHSRQAGKDFRRHSRKPALVSVLLNLAMVSLLEKCDPYIRSIASRRILDERSTSQE